MNKFSNHHLKRNLTDEPALSTNNYIQEDMGHRKRTEDLDWEGPGSRTRAHWPSDAVTKLASGGLILFYFTSFLNISHSFIDIFEYFWHFQIIIWCQLIWGIVLRPMILNLKKNNKYIFFNVMSSKSRLLCFKLEMKPLKHFIGSVSILLSREKLPQWQRDYESLAPPTANHLLDVWLSLRAYRWASRNWKQASGGRRKM